MADRADLVPTRPIGLRSKIMIAAAALAGALVLALCTSIVLSMPTSAARLRTLFVDRVHEATGLRADVSGEAALVLLPSPHVSLGDVDITDATGALRLHAGHVRVDLSFLPLLRSVLDVASIRLDKPTIALDIDAPARSTMGVLAQPPGQALGIVRVDDGEMIIERHDRPGIRLTSLDGVLDWRSVQASASVRATFVLDGRTETLDGWLGAPASLRDGGASPLQIRLNGETLKATVSGAVDRREGTHFTGHTRAQTPELRLLLRSIGLARPDMPALGTCTLNGDLAVDAAGATLSALRLHVAGNDLEGSLAIGPGAEKPTLAGTLAAATLDLQPLSVTFPPMREADGGWSTRALDFSGLDVLDVDLRISTGRTRVAHADIADAALSLMVRARTLDLNLADGRIDNGAAKGHLTLTPRGDGVDLQTSGSFAGADLTDLLQSGVATGLAGRLAGTFSVVSTGASFAALVAGAHGRSDFTVRDGRIGGIDLEQNLRRLDKGEGATRVRFGGTTSFDLARFGIDLAGGTARLDDSSLVGPGAHLAISGTVDLRRQTLDLGGSATRAGTDGNAITDGPQLDIHLAGPWSGPLFEATPLPSRPGTEGPP